MAYIFTLKLENWFYFFLNEYVMSELTYIFAKNLENMFGWYAYNPIASKSFLYQYPLQMLLIYFNKYYSNVNVIMFSMKKYPRPYYLLNDINNNVRNCNRYSCFRIRSNRLFNTESVVFVLCVVPLLQTFQRFPIFSKPLTFIS